jgi:multimeric flavodoxin WrbA
MFGILAGYAKGQTKGGCMKVIGIVGSPRRGEATDTLVRKVLAGAEESGAEVEVYHLDEMEILPCRACMDCKTGEACSQEDEMQELYEALHECDGVVLGTPIYFYNMSAQLKTFTDRLFALLAPGFERRLGEEGRPAVFVVTQGADDERLFRPVIDKMAEAFGLAGLPVRSTLLAAAVEGRSGVLAREELVDAAGRAGRELVE